MLGGTLRVETGSHRRSGRCLCSVYKMAFLCCISDAEFWGALAGCEPGGGECVRKFTCTSCIHQGISCGKLFFWPSLVGFPSLLSGWSSLRWYGSIFQLHPKGSRVSDLVLTPQAGERSGHSIGPSISIFSLVTISLRQLV